jgi:hypothetical protein
LHLFTARQCGCIRNFCTGWALLFLFACPEYRLSGWGSQRLQIWERFRGVPIMLMFQILVSAIMLTGTAVLVIYYFPEPLSEQSVMWAHLILAIVIGIWLCVGLGNLKKRNR